MANKLIKSIAEKGLNYAKPRNQETASVQSQEPIIKVNLDGKITRINNTKQPIAKVGLDGKITAINRKEKKKKSGFFQGSKYFDNGYDFGDVTKTIFWSGADLLQDVTKGFSRTIEGTTDTLGYLSADVLDFFGADDTADWLRDVSKYDVTGKLLKDSDYLEQRSVFGNYSDTVFEGVGNVGAMVLTNAVMPGSGAKSTMLTSFSSAYGNSMSEALRNGADLNTARKSAIIHGTAEAISEQFFSGLPILKTENWGGKVVGKIGSGIEKYFGTNTGKLAMKILNTTGEGFEEIISNMLTSAGNDLMHWIDKDFTYGMEGQSGNALKDMWEAATSKESWDSFISASLTSALTNGGNQFISTTQKNNLIKSYAKENNMTVNQVKTMFNQSVQEKTQAEMQRQPNMNLGQRVETENMAKAKTMKELKRRTFVQPGTETDIYQYQETDNEKVNNARKSLADLKVNNSFQTREMANTAERLARDLGIDIEFTNNEKLQSQMSEEQKKETQGRIVNGFVDKNTGKMYLNVDGDQIANFTIGHETKHFFEANKELNKVLNKALKEYAQLKGRYDEDLARVTKTYTDKNGNLIADPETELMADYVGEFFTDYDFVSNLSTKNPTLFERARDFFQKLYYKATGQKEKLLIKQINDNISKVYREYAKTQPGQNISSSENQLLSDKVKTEIKEAVKTKKQEQLNKESKQVIKQETKERQQAKQKEENILPIAEKVEEKVEEKSKTNKKEFQAIIYSPKTKSPVIANVEGTTTKIEGIDVGIYKDGKNNWHVIDLDSKLSLNTGQESKKTRKAAIESAIKNIQENDIESLRKTQAERYKDIKEDKTLSNKDIQYSLSKDSQGRELSKEQKEYFRDSKLRDKDGNLEVVYHTSPNKFTVFDKTKLGENTGYSNTEFGYFVTPNKNFSQRFGDIDNQGIKGNTMELYANITNPITHPFYAGYKYSGEQLDNIVREYMKATGNEESLNEWESYAEEDNLTLYETYMNMMISEDPFETADFDREELIKNGYDGIEFVEGLDKDVNYGVGNSNEPVSSYAVFNSNQLKNIDNTNPTTSDDIRYSLSNDNENKIILSDGRTYNNYYDFAKDITKNNEDFAKELLFKYYTHNFNVPTNENETTFFHGTDSIYNYDDFKIMDFDEQTMDRNYGDYFYITPDKGIANEYGKQIAQFIIPNDKIMSLEEYRNTNKTDKEIFKDYWAIEMPDNEYIVNDPKTIIEYSKQKAQDYINQNENSTEDSDIRYSLSPKGEMVDNETGEKVELETSDVGNTGTLMAIHNLNEDKLKGILELGGFPVPSIAITNPDIVNHSQFGNISVLFDKSTIDPAISENEVYDRDVWSPTFPQIDYELNDDAIDRVADELGIEDWRLRDAAEDNSKPEYLIERLLREEQLIDKYVKDNNIDYETAYKDAETKVDMHQRGEKIRQFIIDNDFDFKKLYKNKKLQQEYFDLIKDYYDNSTLPQAVKENLYNEKISQLKDFIDIQKGAGDLEPVRQLKRYQDDFDLIKSGENKVVDEWQTNKNKKDAAIKNGIEDYLKEQVKDIYGEKGIRNDRDYLDSRGNRRSFWQLHDEYNLENIVDALTQGDTTGTQNWFAGYGQIQANMANQFNSISDIKANENKLTSLAENNTILEEARNNIENDIDEIVAKNDTDMNIVSELLADFARGDLTVDNFKELTRNYYQTTQNVSDELINKIIDDLNNLKNLPTDYFEAKPQRAVGLDEVQQIVLPNNVDSEFKKQLQDMGIEYTEYDPSIEGDRQRVINQFDDLKFSLSQEGEDLESYYQDLFPIKNKVTTRLSDLKRKEVELPNEEENTLKTSENEQKQGEKPTRREVIDGNRQLARELLGDITQIKDKKRGLLYQINTMKRNLMDIMSKKQAQKMYDTIWKPITENNAKIENEITSYNEKIQKYNINDKESTYIQMLGELRYNPETTLTKQQVDDFYNKNASKIDQQKCEKAIPEFRQIYDELIEKVNDVLTDNGYKPIEYRKGYFPHFIEEKATSKLGKLAEKLGWKVKKGQLPTDIAGITDQFKPGKAWTSFSQQRTGDATDYNALKGLDNYLRGAMDVIYHTNDIQKLRALENEIRYQYSSKGVQDKINEIYADENLDMEEKNDAIANLTSNIRESGLGNFVTEIRNYTDNLANKKAFGDRSMEQTLGRDVYSIMNNINGRVSANMVGANISSAITNFIPITQAWSQLSTKNLMRGMYESIKTSIKGDNFADRSTFLTNRTKQAERLYNTKMDKLTQKLGVPFEAIDSFTSNTIVRAKYYDNIAKGMTEQEAMANADEFAKDVMAGRSKGDQPTIFNRKNPLFKLFTAFQLEVNNQYGYMFKDIPTNMADEAKRKLVGAFIKMFLGAWLYNEITEKFTGRRAAFDPIDMAISDVQTLTDENMDLGDKIQSIVKDTAQEVPFVSGLAGGGRLPIQGAIPYSNPLEMVTKTFEDIGKLDDPEKRKTAINNLKKEWSKPVYYLLFPVAGGQVKKTVEGLSMYDKDLPIAGSYTNSGKLRFEADTSTLGKIQSAVFGQYASKNAREYFKNGYTPLTEGQVEEALEAELPINEYREINQGIKDAKAEAKAKGENQTEAMYDYIYDLPIEMEQKNSLINSRTKGSSTIKDDNGYIKYVDDKGKTYWYDKKNDIVYNNKYKEMDTKDIADLTKASTQKDISNYANYGSLAEFNYSNKNPEKYLALTKIADYDTFMEYKDELAAIKQKYDNKTTEFKKKKVFEYINSLPLSVEQKLMLQKMGAGYSIKQYRGRLHNYINNMNLTKEQKQAIDKVLFD